MAHIYVEHDKLQTGVVALRAHKSTFDEVLATLESGLAPMIGSWSGEARELYLAKKKLWDNASLDLTNLLHHIATITEDAHIGYGQAVTNVTDAWT